MTRREFCMGMGSSAALWASQWTGRSACGATTMPAIMDNDPAGGFAVRPMKQLLFFDYRHILPGDLTWRKTDGTTVSTDGSPEGPVPVYADTSEIAYGIRLAAQPAMKELIGDSRAPGPVIYDDGLYRSWGLNARYPADQSESRRLNYAESITVRYGESKDGFEWTVRDACEVKPCNSNLAAVGGGDFFIDPKGPPEERYKAVVNAKLCAGQTDLRARYRKIHPRHRDQRVYLEDHQNPLDCLWGFVSPDGLNWTMLPEPLLINECDTDNAAYYDEFLGKYVVYTRLYWMSRRMIARAESDDFRHWTPVEPVVQPPLDDPLNSDLYLNARTTYPGEPSYHLMFPLLYERFTQTSVVHLYSSIDGIRWQRVPGGPVLSPSTPDKPDGAFIGMGRHLVPLGKDRVGIRCWGTGYPHKFPRWKALPPLGEQAWATWPRGRLSALVADEVGQFSTFPASLSGQALRLNVRVKRAGEVKVGVVVEDKPDAGRPVAECDPIIGDHLDYTVTWKGSSDVNAKPGSKVRLFFKLRAAELFGIEWV